MLVTFIHATKPQQVINTSLSFSTVSPVVDYEKDPRICLTSVHIPHQKLLAKVQNSLIAPLRKIAPDYFYYPPDSLHMTIKNIRVINDPPHFAQQDIQKAQQVFQSVIPRHKKFPVYFYRLLVFPHNLALMGTTDPELDNIIFDLDKSLQNAGIPDDKHYLNAKYFFSNMTLARFNTPPTKEFLQKVTELSQMISFEPYIVDSVTLLTCTAVFTKRSMIQTWGLK